MQTAQEFPGYGEIWANARVRATKARDDYFCQSRDCDAMIHKGDTYYAEYRGSLDSIRRCAKCFAERREPSN